MTWVLILYMYGVSSGVTNINNFKSLSDCEIFGKESVLKFNESTHYSGCLFYTCIKKT